MIHEGNLQAYNHTYNDMSLTKNPKVTNSGFQFARLKVQIQRKGETWWNERDLLHHVQTKIQYMTRNKA